MTQKETQIQQAVKKQLSIHPKSTLIDIYKSFFQGAFGPGHMIESREAALDYLKYELKTAVDYDTLLWQETGHQQRYYRINLRLIKDGIIPIDTLLTAFVESANTAQPPSIEEWKNEWAEILKVIEELDLQMVDFAVDKQTLEKLLAQNKIVLHHSKVYSELYQPHYRIINKNHFDRLLKLITGE